MELYGKALVYVVFILIILHIVQYLVFKPKHKYSSPVESFQNITQTYISKMEPSEGDSSTIVKLEGSGFDYISKIYLEHQGSYAQCIILSNRNDETVEFIPPAITELGKSLKDIRDIIKAQIKSNNNDEGVGVKTNVVFVRGDKNKDYALSFNSKNVFKVPNLHFYYIDRIPYKNNCPKPKIAPAPTVEEEVVTLNPGNTRIEFEAGTDLEFLNKILPEKQEKIEKLYDTINKGLDKFSRLNTRNIEQLKQFQALESVRDMKRQFNIERYNIHQYLNKHYRNKKN